MSMGRVFSGLAEHVVTVVVSNISIHDAIAIQHNAKQSS